MDIFALALRLVTTGRAEMENSLNSVNQKGKEAADTLNDDLSGAVDHLIERMVEMISIWEAGRLFKEMITDAAELAVTLRRTEQMTGITAERLAELGEAAELNYMPVEQLNTGFRRLAMSMTDVNSKGAQAFKAMGLDIKSFHGDADAALTALAGKISQYRDGMEKAALLNEIFGRGGAQWAPLLNNLKETDEQVKQLGQTMTKEQQDTMLKYEQAMIRLKITSDGFARQIATATVPALESLAKSFTISLRNGEEFNVVAEIITGTVRFLATVAILVEAGFIKAGHAIGNMAAIIVDTIPIAAKFGTILSDFFHRDWDKLSKDVGDALKTIKGDFAQLNYDLEADALSTKEKLLDLYGMGKKSSSGPEKKKGTRTAPTLPDPKDEEEAKRALERYLRNAREEIAVDNAKYALDVKRAQDFIGMETDRYKKIEALDQEHLQFLMFIYGENSTEYQDQLKLMEEHHKHHLDAMLREEEEYAKNLKEIDRMMQGWKDEENRMKLEKTKEFAQLTTNSIEAIFKAGFAKGGTIGSAMKAFADTVLQGVGSMMTRLGETYLTYGGIMDALSALLPDPFTAGPAALAIGAALIALGSALGSIGSGGGGGGGGAGSTGGAPVSSPTQVVFGINGANAAPSSSGVTPVNPTHVTVIGPNDPQAQRQISELMKKASVR